MPRVSVRVSPRQEFVATLYLVGLHGEIADRRRRREDVEEDSGLVPMQEFFGSDEGIRTPTLTQRIQMPSPVISIFDRPLSDAPPPILYRPKTRDRVQPKREPQPADPEQRKQELAAYPLRVPARALKQFVLRVLRCRRRLEELLKMRLQRRLKWDRRLERRFSLNVLIEEEERLLKQEVNALFFQGDWVDDLMVKGLFVRRVTRKNRRYYFSIDPNGFIVTVYTARGYWNAKQDRHARRRRHFLRQYDA